MYIFLHACSITFTPHEQGILHTNASKNDISELYNNLFLHTIRSALWSNDIKILPTYSIFTDRTSPLKLVDIHACILDQFFANIFQRNFLKVFHTSITDYAETLNCGNYKYASHMFQPFTFIYADHDSVKLEQRLNLAHYELLMCLQQDPELHVLSSFETGLYTSARNSGAVFTV